MIEPLNWSVSSPGLKFCHRAADAVGEVESKLSPAPEPVNVWSAAVCDDGIWLTAAAVCWQPRVRAQ